MFFFSGEMLVFPYIFPHSGSRLRPMAFDIPQRIKDGKVKIDGRDAELTSKPGCCHLILDSVSGINLRQRGDTAISLVDVIFDCAVIFGDISKFLHVCVRERFPVVLANSLTDGFAGVFLLESINENPYGWENKFSGGGFCPPPAYY